MNYFYGYSTFFHTARCYVFVLQKYSFRYPYILPTPHSARSAIRSAFRQLGGFMQC